MLQEANQPTDNKAFLNARQEALTLAIQSGQVSRREARILRFEGTEQGKGSIVLLTHPANGSDYSIVLPNYLMN